MSVLATKALGNIKIKSTEIFQFLDGFYGFPDDKEFALVQAKQDSPFLWLQSTQKENLAFVVIDPYLFCKDRYHPKISQSDLDILEVKSVDECSVFVIVTIPSEHPEEMTANMQGPVLLHRGMKKGRQVISLDNSHHVQVPILSFLES